MMEKKEDLVLLRADSLFTLILTPTPGSLNRLL